MPDLLLSNSYFLELDEHEKTIMKPYAPLGPMSLSSYLKSRGADVYLHDTTFTTLATAGSNYAFRGVAYVKGTPEPGSFVLAAVTGLGIAILGLRHKKRQPSVAGSTAQNP